jgi:hypothetical protein
MPLKDAEERKAYQKAYQKAYREANREKFAEYHKAYFQSLAGKKSSWKQRGLLHDDYDTLYEAYLQTTNCDVCKVTFKDTFDRCMDHDHSTGLFRQFLCRPCNNRDSWLLKR